MSKRARRSRQPAAPPAASPAKPAFAAPGSTQSTPPSKAAPTSSRSRRRIQVGIVLLAGAFAVSLFLAWHSLAGTAVPGCSAAAACHSVLSGRWGQVLGVPASLPGAAIYAGMIVLGFAALRGNGDRFQRLRVAGATLIIGAALWFTILQAAVIRAFCPWCCTAHALAAAGSLLLGWRIRQGADDSAVRPPAGWGPVEILAPLAAVGILAALQAGVRPPERIATGEVDPASSVARAADGTLALDGRAIRLTPGELPMIGSPEAEVVGLALTDHTCPHCRALHGVLEEIVAEAPERAAFVLVPAYRDERAGTIHRIMLATWKQDPAHHEELSRQLMAGAADADPDSLLAKVQDHFQSRFFEIAWNHAAWIDAALADGRRLVAANDTTLDVASLPQLMIGSRVVAGEPRPETIREMIAAARAGETPRAPAPLAGTDPAQPPATPATPATPAGPGHPKIEFVNATLELPEVVQGETAHGTFRFRNTGDAPLTLTKIKPSCGCTAVDGWEQTVPPGGEGSFEVKLDTKRFSGRVTKSIDIMSNASNATGGLTKVAVAANIWLPVRLSTNSASFGTILTGTTAEPREIRISVTDDQPLDLPLPTSSNPYFAVNMETVDPGREYVVTVTIPALHEATEQGELTVQLGHPRLDKITLPLYARVADPVEISPKEIVLSPAAASQAQQRYLIVYCHDRERKEFAITGVDVAGTDGILAESEPSTLPNAIWTRIKVTIPAGLDPVAAEAAGAGLTVRTNHPAFPELHVPLRAFRPPFTGSSEAIPTAVSRRS